METRRRHLRGLASGATGSWDVGASSEWDDTTPLIEDVFNPNQYVVTGNQSPTSSASSAFSSLFNTTTGYLLLGAAFYFLVLPEMKKSS